MAISPLMSQAVVQRSQDISPIKQAQDQKPIVDQANFQTRMTKEVEQHLEQVTKYDGADKKNEHYDAKEKGNGFYFGEDGKKKKKEEKEEGKIVKKDTSHFDAKI